MIAEDELLTIYRGTVHPLYAYVSHRTGADRELTEDTVQETYMRALADWRRKGAPGVPLAWLKTVARNILISHYRRINPTSLEGQGIDVEDENWDPEKKGNAELLYYGLAHLRNEQSHLIEAFYFNDKSIREIAAEHGLSERAVEGRLRRARKKLKKYLRRVSQDGGVLR